MWRWIVAAVVLTLADPASQARSRHSIRVQVLDELGAAISGAEVFIHRDGLPIDAINENAFPDQTTTTDHVGLDHVAAPDGFFDVCVMSSAFTPACKKVEVHGRDVTAEFRLRADPIVTKRLGDTFE